MLATLLVLAGVLAPVRTINAGPCTEDDPPFDFAALSKEYLAELTGEPGELTFDELIDGASFVRCGLGSFEIRYPVSALDDKKNAADLEELALAVVEFQRHWHAWRLSPMSGGGAGGDTPLSEDWDVLRKWIRGWSARKLAKASGGPLTLYDQLKTSDEVKAAQQRLAESTRPNRIMKAWVGDTNVLVIGPTRRDFLGLLAVGGHLDPSKQESLWDGKNLGRTAAWVNWTQILCPVKADFPLDPKKPFASSTLATEKKSDALQFLIDRAVLLLLRKEFYPNGTHFFEVTLGTNLVIATAGENNQYAGDWNLEYRTSGSQTRSYSRFVPGGNPAGGSLPARSAGPGISSGSAVELSRYRVDGGRDYFLEALQEGQRLGAKLAAKIKSQPQRKNKVPHFELSSRETHKKVPVTAPFLGEYGRDKKLPPLAYLDDYEDFFRAYRSSFVNWLQAHGSRSEEEAGAQFAELLKRHSQRTEGVEFFDVVAEVYGIPLSGEGPESDSLEWRYLDWLKKQ